MWGRSGPGGRACYTFHLLRGKVEARSASTQLTDSTIESLEDVAAQLQTTQNTIKVIAIVGGVALLAKFAFDVVNGVVSWSR